MTAKQSKAWRGILAALMVAGVTAGSSALAAADKDAVGAAVEKRFAEGDTNGDGVITLSEIEDKLREYFNTLDPNIDGVISFNELPKVLPETDRQQARLERRLKIAEGVAERRDIDIDEDKIRERTQVTRAKFMARLDANGDEEISFEEFARPHKRRFGFTDSDKNGEVTLEEMQAVAKKMRKRMRKRFRGRRGGDQG